VTGPVIGASPSDVTFAVCVYEGGFTGRKPTEFLSRDRLHAVAEVERLLVEHAT
jgi:hypothetical protein